MEINPIVEQRKAAIILLTNCINSVAPPPLISSKTKRILASFALYSGIYITKKP